MKRLFLLFVAGILLTQSTPLYAGKKPTPKKRVRLSTSRLTRLLSAGIQTHEALARRISELEQKNAQLAVQNQLERAYQSQLFDRARRAVFRAFPYESSSGHAFTGTIIKHNYKGHEEIFGIVATHALQGVPYSAGLFLNKEFQAVYVHGNVAHTIPAKVVQFSPFSMRDLALVKFDPEFEILFDPIPLEDFALKLPAQGYSQGYACNILSKQTFPIVGMTSVGTLTSRLPAAELGQRSGLCGAPVFTKDFRLAGIHIGSSYTTNTGYIAPLSTIKSLIQAYHAADTQPILLSIGGREIGRLAVNEFVSRIEILDASYRTLWKEDTKAKFSLGAAEEELTRHPQAAYIRLTIGKSVWEQDAKGSYILDDNSHPRLLITPVP